MEIRVYYRNAGRLSASISPLRMANIGVAGSRFRSPSLIRILRAIPCEIAFYTIQAPDDQDDLCDFDVGCYGTGCVSEESYWF